MSKKESLVIGNWKLNPATAKTAESLITETKKLVKKSNCIIGVAPVFVHLPTVGKKTLKSNIKLVAQDVSVEPLGAFTGEVSAGQLRDLGVSHVIIGHSERRAQGETDQQVVRKVQAALKNKLTPIVCVGEKERDVQGNFYAVVQKQIAFLTSALSETECKKIVIAYEPIWAIGTGKTASVEDIKEMQLFIYSTLAKAYSRIAANKIRLLYGGSVKPHNAKRLYIDGGMNGFLVGGASLKAKDFAAIITAIE